MKKNLIIFPKGALSKTDRTALQRCGFLPIEADDPSKIVLPDFTPSVGTKDVLLAMADGLKAGAWHEQEFGRSLLKRLQKNLAPQSSP